MSDSLEFNIFISREEQVLRSSTCSTCDNFVSASTIEVEIIDAVTGETKTTEKKTYDTCRVNGAMLSNYLTLKQSTCPVNRW